jgi:predicted dehydrogenase
MEKKVLRAGIVGSGFAAKFHYEALQRVFSARVEVLGAYSVSSTNLQRFTEPRGLRAFSGLDELIDNTDVIHVCTPPVTHEPIVIAALQKNRHVIVEKPFTGYFGDGSDSFNGDTFPKQTGLDPLPMGSGSFLEEVQ